MKRIYKNVLMAAIATLPVFSEAQVATLYSFTQSSGAYSAISGGTVFGTMWTDDEVFTDPNNPTIGWNSQGPGIPIGFSFMFNNTTFDRIGVSSNGWISFGQSALNPSVDMDWSTYTAISSSYGAAAIFQNRVAGLSRDIQAQSGAGIRVETIGTAPNRVLVVQFENYKRYGGTGSGDNFHFQIRLLETTNIVEVVYGSFTLNSNQSSAEVGLRGMTNSDFNNRIVNGVSVWSNSIPGTQNFSSVNFSSSLFPAVGQTYRWTPPQCSGTLASLTSTGNISLVCPGGSSNLSLLNSYTVSGIVYNWSHSTSSAVGPFTVIANSNGASFNATNINMPTWYQVTSTCLNGSSTSTSTSFGVQIAGTTTNSVPYFEGFEGIVMENQLPNCSWDANSPVSICQTYTSTQTNNRLSRTGSKFASFYTYYITGDNYFYTNGIQLYAGITYSASMWYTTEYYGYTNVTDLSMLVGPNQSTTGLVPIATTGGPAASPVYKALTNTFTVPSDGLYYVAIRATSDGNWGTQWLSWDDLEIIIPCSLNSPTVSLSASSTTICSGDPVNLTANGADTYSWSTGGSGSSITDMPNVNTLYTVTGMNDLSGCAQMQTQMVIVNPAPQIIMYANKPAVCAGEPVSLTAFGASSFTWSNASNNAMITVTANATSVYTVLGSNSYNCSSTSTLQIIVHPNPVVNVTSLAPDQSKMCRGESVTLVGGGAGSTGTYQWASASSYVQAMSAIVSPNTTTTYTLTGIDANGCKGTTTYVQNVDECTGVNEITGGLNAVKVYPNPTAGIFTIELNNADAKTIQVTDLTGRVVLTNTGSDEKINVNIDHLANGIYYVKVQSNNATEVIRIVKH